MLHVENITLQYAEEHGEISTVPVDAMINETPSLKKEFGWVSPLVSTFIVVSISVSFVTLGTGKFHLLFLSSTFIKICLLSLSILHI